MRRFIALATLLACTATQAAPVFRTDSDDRLLGITDVEVKGTLYDVAFSRGTIHDGYELTFGAPADFPFSTRQAAIDATQALWEVIRPTQYGDYPFLNFGCFASGTMCNMETPYTTIGRAHHQSYTAVLMNGLGFNDDLAFNVRDNYGQYNRIDDTLLVWSKGDNPPTKVSEPGTLLTVLLALPTLLLAYRRRKQHQPRA